MLPCYVIHLKRAHERSVSIAQEMTKFNNSTFTIVPAIDVQDPQNMRSFMEINRIRLFNDQIPKAPLACFLSHLKTFDLIYRTHRSGVAVIFEDDFQRIDSPKSSDVLIQEVLEELGDIDFDICFLGSLHRPPNPDYCSSGENPVYKLDSKVTYNHSGTHASLVNIQYLPNI
jgi:hypothetical protein